MSREYPGELVATAIYEDGVQAGVKIFRADPLIVIHTDIADQFNAPGVTFDGTELTIEAVNGTWRYLLTEDGARAHGTHLARLIESPVDVLSLPRVVDSPCGPVLGSGG